MTWRQRSLQNCGRGFNSFPRCQFDREPKGEAVACTAAEPGSSPGRSSKIHAGKLPGSALSALPWRCARITRQLALPHRAPHGPIAPRILGGAQSVVEAEGDDAAPCDGVLSGCEFHRSPHQGPVSTAAVQPLRKRKVARSNRGTGRQINCPLAGWSGRQALNLE